MSNTSLAQVFTGGGIQDGLDAAARILGIPSGDPRVIAVSILSAVLNFAALIATIMIVIAGFYLVLSMGEDERKDKAKKIIIYTLIGLLVLLFARLLVSLVTKWLPSEIGV